MAGPGEWVVYDADGKHTVGVHAHASHVWLQIAGVDVAAEVLDPTDAALDLFASGGSGDVETPMPGVVVRLLCEPGDVVEEGQAVVVVEAMKMENEFKAPYAGTVRDVHVAVGQTVDAHTVLVSLETESAP
jgi:biotin carboxyl carrier protein